MNESTFNFIKANANADIRQLALSGAPAPDIDLHWSLDQIAGRQKARTKLPSWAAVEGIVYPPHLSMEQCSSEQTAHYKAQLAGSGRLMGDLTGGFGVDFSMMSRTFEESVYVERQERLCDIAKENFRLLGMTNVQTVCADGIDFLRTDSRHYDLLYLDPARRDEHGARTYGIADCTPDVLTVKEMLLDKADRVLLKLSPMLDWRKAVSDLGTEVVRQVHIVSVAGECKELLILLSREGEGLRLLCVNDDEVWTVETGAEPGGDNTSSAEPPMVKPLPGHYLYEPNASIMKSGCFAELADDYGVSQVGPNSHLFTSATAVADFPGRHFVVEAMSTLNKRELKNALKGLKQANISTRNFPMSVADLRKRLKLSEGGNTFIFATTLAERSHVLLICSKVARQIEKNI